MRSTPTVILRALLGISHIDIGKSINSAKTPYSRRNTHRVELPEESGPRRLRSKRIFTMPFDRTLRTDLFEV